MPQSAQAAPPSALHAARCRHAVRQGLKLLAVVVLAVVVGVSVLDQRRVSQRNVRSHVFSSNHPPGHAARNTRPEAADDDPDDDDDDDDDDEQMERAPMPWPTPRPTPDDLDEEARAPMPWPTPRPTPAPRPATAPPTPRPAPRPAPVGPEEECFALQATHGVKPGVSWGTLDRTPSSFRRWKQLGCGGVVERAANAAADAAADAAREVCPESAEPLPLVAVCSGTTTRKGGGWITPRPGHLEDLAAFQYLLPSFKRTAECGFRYLVVLAYDVGDQFWDRGDGVARARAWFEASIATPLAAANMDVELRFVKVDNTAKKPGPVFAAMTRAAYAAWKADYIYRVNDDTEFKTKWARPFVNALASMGNVGAVGPLCRQGNTAILTHDFTHRTHMDIFDGAYYPPELSDWWMDDWITGVYGSLRTLMGDRVEVTHHTGKHGQRYAVDFAHEKLVKQLITAGNARVAAYVAARDAPPPGNPPPSFRRFRLKTHGGFQRRRRLRAAGRDSVS